MELRSVYMNASVLCFSRKNYPLIYAIGKRQMIPVFCVGWSLSPILQEAENLDESSLNLSHSFVAELSDIEAKSLELPLTVPYQLRIWDEGNWVDDTYELHSEFLDRGQPVFIDERVGCLVKVGRYRYRIPSPLYELIDEVNKFYLLDRDGKIESCSRINNLLDVDSEHTKNIDPEKTVANIRIRHVSGFSAGVVGSIEDPELSVVLFANHAIEEAENRGKFSAKPSRFFSPIKSIRLIRNFIILKKHVLLMFSIVESIFILIRR